MPLRRNRRYFAEALKFLNRALTDSHSKPDLKLKLIDRLLEIARIEESRLVRIARQDERREHELLENQSGPQSSAATLVPESPASTNAFAFLER